MTSKANAHFAHARATAPRWARSVGGRARDRSRHRLRTRALARNAFITSLAYATPGAYVAEALRAFYGCDEPIVGWPAATPERFAAIDPLMHSLTARLSSRIPFAVGRLAS